MPELPEVETIRRGMIAKLIGRTICDLVVGDRAAVGRILQLGSTRLGRAISGQTIRGLRRRGKFLIFELDRHYLIIHLGMTGQLTVQERRRIDRHTHVQIAFETGEVLVFRDTRQFGKVFLLQKKQELLTKFFFRLGLEPFTPEYSFENFLQKFHNRKLRLKSLLLDQRFVAGVGNIYADEALYEAGLHPARAARSLGRFEKEKLFRAIQTVLERGIAYGGSTLRDYVNSDGEAGHNQEELKVYGREQEPCERCGSLIRKIVISQRGTHYCPTCQPRRRTTSSLLI